MTQNLFTIGFHPKDLFQGDHHASSSSSGSSTTVPPAAVHQIAQSQLTATSIQTLRANSTPSNPSQLANRVSSSSSSAATSSTYFHLFTSGFDPQDLFEGVIVPSSSSSNSHAPEAPAAINQSTHTGIEILRTTSSPGVLYPSDHLSSSSSSAFATTSNAPQRIQPQTSYSQTFMPPGQRKDVQPDYKHTVTARTNRAAPSSRVEEARQRLNTFIKKADRTAPKSFLLISKLLVLTHTSNFQRSIYVAPALTRSLSVAGIVEQAENGFFTNMEWHCSFGRKIFSEDDYLKILAEAYAWRNKDIFKRMLDSRLSPLSKEDTNLLRSEIDSLFISEK